MATLGLVCIDSLTTVSIGGTLGPVPAGALLMVWVVWDGMGGSFTEGMGGTGKPHGPLGSAITHHIDA